MALRAISRKARKNRTRGFLCLLLLIASASASSAQTVVGRVVEDATVRPLAGAFVVIETPEGTQRGGVLTGEDGRFVLRPEGPGRYRLVVRLIGYADTPTELFDLSEGESAERTVRVPVRAVSLEGIRAEIGQRCRTRPGGSQMARVWQEARKALDIAEWTHSERALKFRISHYKRELDAQTLRVTAMTEQPREGYYDGSPYRSVPAEQLAENGYVQPAPGGSWDHYGPDAEVLLSRSFLDTHCFSVAPSDSPNLVGLAFEPVPGRSLPDIEGVLWVDRGSAELRRLQFTYRNLPYPHGDWDSLGGEVEFRRLATGMWIVSRWAIRMPLEARPEGGHGGSARTLALVSLVEEGAQVREVRTASGEILAEASGATLYGVVEDSVTGEPLEGASVALLPTNRTVVTGDDGAYRIVDLPAGNFRLRIEHPEIELLGGEPVVRDIRLERGRATRVAVKPDLGRLARALCLEQNAVVHDPVVLYGHVRTPDGETPVPGALVRGFSGGDEKRGLSNANGGYALCMPRNDTLTVAAVGAAGAVSDRRDLEANSVRPRTRSLVRQDLTLDTRAFAVASSRSASRRGAHWSSALIGTVLTEEDRSPIPGAMVLVRDREGRSLYSDVTDEEGRFRFMHPDHSTREFDLSVEHVAYGKTRQSIRFAPGEQLHAEVVLTERPIEVDPVVVTARRQDFLAQMGFYDRVEQGTAIYIQREEIERRRPSRVTDLLVGRPLLQLFRARSDKVDVRVTGSGRRLGGSDCQPSIWIDGVLARDAGAPRLRRLGKTRRVVYESPFLTELINPDEIEAMEVYTGPTGLPMQYGGSNADCGVLLIWTRRR